MNKETGREKSSFGRDGYRGYKVRLQLIREGMDEYDPVYIGGPEDVYGFMKELEDFDRETFYTLHLDAKNKVISCEEVTKGHLSGCPIHPREVYKAALLSSAQSVILVHNHPSGDPTPSEEDVESSKRLCECGDLLGIEVLDSVTIGKGSYYSLFDEGRINRKAFTPVLPPSSDDEGVPTGAHREHSRGQYRVETRMIRSRKGNPESS